jgi:hypothetical protein
MYFNYAFIFYGFADFFTTVLRESTAYYRYNWTYLIKYGF